MNESVYDERINRVNDLLDRLDKIPQELDAIYARLDLGGLDRRMFAALVDRRNALLVEQENKTRELKQVYGMDFT